MRAYSLARSIGLLLATAAIAGCAGSTIRPVLSPSTPNTDAVLVLPGFGYGRHDETVFRALAAETARQGIDFYTPKFIVRGGLNESRENLRRFIRDQRLDRYDRLHVFAFLAGAWTFNPLQESAPLANLTTVIYDRSPFQERAPRIASEKLHFLTWLKYGSPVFDLAKTPYPALTAREPRVALVVETAPTRFVKRYEKTALSYGPLDFTCSSFEQRYDDCLFVQLNHNEMYERFAQLWPEILEFIRTGRFTRNAERSAPRT